MSNWRVFRESLDPESQEQLELSLSQLPEQEYQPPNPLPSQGHQQEEAGPSEQRKRPRLDQLWHGNLQDDAQALVILLQHGSLEVGGRDVFFEGCFEGSNKEQYFCMVRPIKDSPGHQRWLKGPVRPLPRIERTAYVARIVQRILEFLEMGKI